MEDARDAAPGRRRRSASRSTSGTSPSASARTSSTTSSPSTPPAARRTRACAATRRSSSPRCSTGRWRSASTRSSPATTPGSTDGVLRRSVDPAKDQSYVLAVLTREQLAGTVLPARRPRPRRRCGRGGAPAGWPSPTSPTARRLLHRRRRHRAASCAAASARSRGRSSTRDRGASSGRTTARTASPSGSGAGWRWTGPAPDGRRATCSSIEPVAGTVTVGPGEALDVGAVTGPRPVWAAGPPPAEPLGCLVQLRAHGPCRARASSRSAPATVAVRLDEPVRGVATGQAAVLLRRRPRARLGHHRGDRARRRREPAEAGSASAVSRTAARRHRHDRPVRRAGRFRPGRCCRRSAASSSRRPVARRCRADQRRRRGASAAAAELPVPGRSARRPAGAAAGAGLGDQLSAGAASRRDLGDRSPGVAPARARQSWPRWAWSA